MFITKVTFFAILNEIYDSVTDDDISAISNSYVDSYKERLFSFGLSGDETKELIYCINEARFAVGEAKSEEVFD